MVFILSTSQSIKYLFSCRLSISSIILLNSWTSFMLPTDLAVTCQLFWTAASIIAWRMENPVGEETVQPFKNRTNIRTTLDVWQRVHKKLFHLKGHRLTNSLQLLHYLRKQQCVLFLLCHCQSHWFSRIVRQYITVRRIKICPIYHIMTLSGMFMVMLGSMPAENRSLQPLLGQKSISFKSQTEGVICLCRLQQWVINWQRSKHCVRMPIKSLYWLLEPWTRGEYFTDVQFDFKKCF